MHDLGKFLFRCVAMLAFLAGAGHAQERFVLLIDGSGSMWGQVDGEAKISILRRNLDSLLGELDTNADVGLFAFGHREKGNCADIEEIVPPGPFDRAVLGAAIAGIQPKGKTPLADAVRQAAESLRFTEEKATVVILGDGRESCGMDPCSTAEELERTGVDFTVHAIAFDLADEEGTRQLQCFARETGGSFFEAADSVELVAALEEVRQEVAPERPAADPEPEPEPEPVVEKRAVRLVARDADTGAEIPGTLEWTFINTQNEEIIALSAVSGTENDEIAPGDYEVIVQSDDAFGEGRATVGAEGISEIVIEIVSAAPAGIVLGSDSVSAGAVLEVEWTFQGRPDDLLFIASPSGSDDRYPANDERRHVVADGEVARLVAPASAGTYEVRYFSPSAGGVLHRATFRVTPGEVSLEAPDEALAGSSIEVHWSGPAAPGDIIFIAPVDWSTDVYPSGASHRIETTRSPLRVPVPNLAGRHEIRYFSWANGATMAAVPLDVTLRAAQLSAPPSVPAGAVVPVEFSGPRLSGDTLFFIGAATDENRYYRGEEHRGYASGGSPAQMTAPADPGRYEIRYFSPDNGGLLARFPIEVVAPEVTLDAPRLVQRGETFRMRVSGPDAPGDIVFVAETGSPENRYPGDPDQRYLAGPGGGGFLDDDGMYVFDVVAPAHPGSYEIRYLSWSNAAILDRRALIVR